MCTYPRRDTNNVCNSPLIAFLNCLSIVTRASACSLTIMTGKVLLIPKNAYFKYAGSAFNSNTGGSSIEGFVGGDS